MSAPGVIIELDEVTVYSACVGAACNEAGSQESQLIFFFVSVLLVSSVRHFLHVASASCFYCLTAINRIKAAAHVGVVSL